MLRDQKANVLKKDDLDKYSYIQRFDDIKDKSKKEKKDEIQKWIDMKDKKPEMYPEKEINALIYPSKQIDVHGELSIKPVQEEPEEDLASPVSPDAKRSLKSPTSVLSEDMEESDRDMRFFSPANNAEDNELFENVGTN